VTYAIIVTDGNFGDFEMKRRPSEQRAKERHTRNNGGVMPRQSAGWSERFDTQGRSGVIKRRKPQPLHPHCHATKAMWGIVARWKAANEPADLVHTRLDDDDVTVRAAAYQYLKQLEK